MTHRLLLFFAGLLLALLAAPSVAASTEAQHPEIHHVESVVGVENGRSELIVELLASGRNGGEPVAATVTFYSDNNGRSWRTKVIKNGRWDRAQWRTFRNYSRRVLACQDDHSNAHAYDDSTTHNPTSPIDIYSYAAELASLRTALSADCNATPPPIPPSPPKLVTMPLIHHAELRELYDPYDHYDYWHVVVETTNSDGLTQLLTFQNERLTPDNWGYWPKATDAETAVFVDYTLAALSCDDANAQAYDEPATWQAASNWSIFDYAAFLTDVRQRRDWCADDAPPLHLAPTCNPAVAPHVDDLEPDSSSFFYTYIELSNDSYHQLGFEHDGDRWEFVEQYTHSGNVGDCQAQLDRFTSYTMAILTSPDCTAEPVYEPEIEEGLEWYKTAVSAFCQQNAGQAAAVSELDFEEKWGSLGHNCEDEIASTMLFLRLTLLQGTVWNAAFHNLQPPYDYSAGQLGLEMLATGYPTSKLGVVDAYLDYWNAYGNVDNWILLGVTVELRPYLRTLAEDLGQAC